MQRLQSRVDEVPALQHICTFPFNPGGVFSTGIMREQAWLWRWPLRRMLIIMTLVQRVVPNGALRTADKAATDILNACFEVDQSVIKRWPRGSYSNCNVKKTASEESRDERKQMELWQGNLKLVDLFEKDTELESQIE